MREFRVQGGLLGGGIHLKRTIRISTLAALVLALGLVPGVAKAAITASPTSLTFGNQQVGTSSATKAVTVTISCPGGCLLQTFTPSVTAPPPFTQTNNCVFVLVPSATANQTCTINVGFAPTAVGAAAGTLTTSMGGPTVALSGTGVPAATAPGAGGVAGKAKCKKSKGAATAKKKKKGCKKRKKKGGK